MTLEELKHEINKNKGKAGYLWMEDEELVETTQLHGKTLSICLKYGIKILYGDDEAYFQDYINRVYSHYSADELAKLVTIEKLYSDQDEKVWRELIDRFDAKVKAVEEYTEKMLESLVIPYLSEAVLDRLTGGESTCSNAEIIVNAADKRMKQLESLIPVLDRRFGFSAEFPLPSPSEDYDLIALFRWGMARLDYGPSGLKSAVSFLENFTKIEETVKKFTKLIKPIFELMDESVYHLK